jgi:hypothetical protein
LIAAQQDVGDAKLGIHGRLEAEKQELLTAKDANNCRKGRKENQVEATAPPPNASS